MSSHDWLGSQLANTQLSVALLNDQTFVLSSASTQKTLSLDVVATLLHLTLTATLFWVFIAYFHNPPASFHTNLFPDESIATTVPSIAESME